MTPIEDRSEGRRRHILRWVMWLSLAIPVAAVIIYLLIWYGPDLIARHDIGTVTGPLRILRLQQARDAARGRLLTLGAGLFAAGALIFTGRNYKVARETLEVTEQGQVTDRYTKAIEQLGSDRLDVRIGGIYALGRIARDSPRDHPAVMEVLAAFIREHSREEWPPPKPNVESDRMTRPDVQAALTVIGHRDSRYDRGSIDLHNAILGGADLTHAILSGANLSDANFSRAFLDEADLSGAYFYGTVFTGAYLRHANLTDAILTGTDPNEADVTSAYLEAATLTEADLTRARWPPAVAVPEGWERDPDSGLLGRASGETGRNYKVARETLEVTQQGQVTDRYTKAIEQLSSDTMDVRIGGIYALERIARDSPTEHPAVMEVLAAFIRAHCREQWPPPESGIYMPDHTTRPDVQAAFTVIGRRNSRYDRRSIDLSNVDLSGAILTGEANLSGAILNDANLTSAILNDANLSGAHFYGTVLTGAYLRHSNLTDAILTGTDPNEADITSAHLETATLTDADLTRARWPPAVAVPEGWERNPDSGLLGRASGETSDAP